MKQDIKINFGVLEEIATDLKGFIRGIEEMEAGLAGFSTFLASASGKSIELQAEEQKVKEALNQYKTMIYELWNVLEGYINDMTTYIQPENRQTMTRVDRLDISMNVQHIDSALYMWYTPPRTERVSQEIYAKNSSEIEHNRREIEKIEALMQGVLEPLQEKKQDLADIFNRHVVKFEEVGDFYSKKAKKIYDKYTSGFERTKDIGITGWNITRGFIGGVYNGLKDLAGGVVELAYNGVKTAVAYTTVLVMEKPPKWADETVAGTKKIASQILYDPDLLLEGIGQSVSDTYEEKGISYMTGYIAVDIAAEIILTKGIGKLDDLARTGKVAGSFEDIAGTVQAIDKIEDVGHAKIDDILRNGAREHIFNGEVRVNGKIGGGHVERNLIEDIQIIERIPDPPINGQPYNTMQQNLIDGTITKNKTMFPQDWSMEQVERAIGEAYVSREFVHGTNNTWRGTTKSGITIEMYLNGEENIISAFPKL